MSMIEEARAMAAQCWCDPETKDREMDVILAEAFVKRLVLVMQRGQNERQASPIEP